MTGAACPICGDPKAYPFWVGAEPPDGCPEDRAWHAGGPITIKNVTECPYQMKKAWQASEFRKLVPDAFDATGNMRQGRLPDVLMAFAKTHPEKPLVL